MLSSAVNSLEIHEYLPEQNCQRELRFFKANSKILGSYCFSSVWVKVKKSKQRNFIYVFNMIPIIFKVP